MSQPFSKDSKNSGVIAYFVNHSSAAKLLWLSIILIGWLGITSMKQEVFPPFAPKQIHIEIPVRAADPQSVEVLVLTKVENALTGLRGIKQTTSEASLGGAYLMLEIDSDADINAMLIQVQARVDGISDLPSSAEPPVYHLPENTDPVIRLELLSGTQLAGQLRAQLPALLQSANQIRQQAQLLSSVARTALVNPPPMQLSIEVSEQAMQQYQLTLSQIAQAIAQNKVSQSAGQLQTQAQTILVRTDNRNVDLANWRMLPIRTLASGQQLTLADIAQVAIKPELGFVQGQFNQELAIAIELYRDPNVSFAIAKQEIETLLANVNAELDGRAKLVAWRDESREFTSRASLLIKNGVLGFFVICILMGIFVAPKVAVWTALGVPISIFGAIGLLYISGVNVSLNSITLLGFLIALGLIVDDALVIGESIEYNQKQYGDSNQSVITGAHAVAIPATFGALTTMAAFFPLTLTEGEMGSKLGSVGLVVIACLMVSLIESKLVLPSHLRSRRLFEGKALDGKTLKAGKYAWLHNINHSANQKMQQFVNGVYLPALDYCLTRPKQTLLAATAILTVSLSLVPLGVVRTAVIPNIADYELSAAVYLHPSVTAEQKRQIASEFESALLRAQQGIEQKHHLTEKPLAAIAYQIEGNEIAFEIELAAIDGAPYDAYTIEHAWREQFPNLLGVLGVSVEAGAGSGEPIEIQLMGDDPAQLAKAVAAVKSELALQAEIVDVRDSASATMMQLSIAPTPAARFIGLSEAELINRIRGLLYGHELQRLDFAGQEMPVVVKLPDTQLNQISALQNMMLPVADANGDVNFLPLADLAEFDWLAVEGSLIRIDGQRAVTVYANTLSTGRSGEEVVETLEEARFPALFAGFPDINYRIDGESKEANQSIGSLLSASILALFVIFALIALPLRSLRYPALILTLIPFGLIGALWSHALFGMTFSLMSAFGVVALAGVVINNGLLVVDMTRKQQGQMDIKTAITQACCRRFRPIILTSLTTFAGLMPLMWETDPEALWLVPIVTSLGFGLIGSTVVALLVFPALLLLVGKQADWRVSVLDKEEEQGKHDDKATQLAV